jgi:hypothetical protein
MKAYLTTLLLLFSIFGYACICGSPYRKDINEITNVFDFVVIGTVVEYKNSNVPQSGNNDNVVKIKVKSILKGQLNSEYIFVNLFSYESCGYSFLMGKEYVVLGDQIKEFIDMTPTAEDKNGTPPPPPIFDLPTNQFPCYNIEKEAIEYWNTLANNETVIYNDGCFSFLSDSEEGRYFKRNRKKIIK